MSFPARAAYSFIRKGPSAEEFWALKNLFVEVKCGEVLGVIGRNGAGKSTLLKILSRVLEPTGGEAIVNGRVGSLLEVGTGFHSELTGRENIFLSGALLGMRRAEIRRRFDEIVAFAGVEKFLDTQCKHYSSGMYVRLGFAVAAHLDTDILLLDEVLAVGDMEFQRRCLDRVRSQFNSGRTVLLVSHHLALIENVCSRVIVLDGGQMVAHGEPSEMCRRYRDLLKVNGEAAADLRSQPRAQGFRGGLTRVELCDESGTAVPAAVTGSLLTVRLWYELPSPAKNNSFGLVFETADGLRVFQVTSEMAGAVFEGAPQSGYATCSITCLPLLPGRYSLQADLWSAGTHIDHVDHAVFFDVLPTDALGSGRLPASGIGLIWQASKWSVS